MKSFLDRLLGRKHPIHTDEVRPPEAPRAVASPSVTAKRTVLSGMEFEEYRFVAIDVETANGWQGSICQIGIACVTPDNTIKTYGTLIDPECEFDAFNIDLHGISESRVRNAPTFPAAFIDFKTLLLRNRLFQHSSFDKRAFEAACNGYDLLLPEFDWNDSIRVARRAWPELKQNGGYGLANLKTKLGIQFHHHDAVEDARAAATVVLLAEKHTGQRFDELLRRPTQKAYPKSVTAPANTEGKFFGSVIVFTGNLSMQRSEAATLASLAGFEVKASVTKKTSHLVVGDQDLTLLAGHNKSTKHRKAETLAAGGQDIKIIGETEFLKLIK